MRRFFFKNMQIQIFNVPLTDSGERLLEMNRFLSGNKVLEVEQRFFQNEKGGCWSFCVRYLPTVNGFQTASKEKVDYKLVLSEADFALFSRLREIRKQIAIADAVPAYAVFTDDELAECVADEENRQAELNLRGAGVQRLCHGGQRWQVNVSTQARQRHEQKGEKDAKSSISSLKLAHKE